MAPSDYSWVYDGSEYYVLMPDVVVTFVGSHASFLDLTVGGTSTTFSSQVTVPYGSDLVFTITPETGYAVSSVENASLMSGSSYTATVTSDTTITAAASILTFTVVWYDEDGNTPLHGPTTLDYGSSVPTYEDPVKSADASYTYAGHWALVSGTLGAGSTVVDDLVYRATYTSTKVQYTVTINGDGVTVMNGSENVVSGTTVDWGTSLTVTIADKEGNSKSVTASTGEIGSDGSYTMPTEDVTFTGSYTPKTFNITYGPGVSGPSEAVYGTTVNVTASPGTGYSLRGISATGTSVAVSGNGGSFTMPAQDVTVTATFDELTYTLTYTVDGTTVHIETHHYGDNLTVYSYTAPEGSTFGGWTNFPSDAKMPAGDLTVTGMTTEIDYSITVSSDHGSTTAPKTAHSGNPITFTVKPDDGWKLSGVSVTAGGSEVIYTGSDGTYSFTMPSNDVVIGLAYEQITYTITWEYREDGAVKTTSETHVYGDSLTPPDVSATDVTDEVTYTFTGSWSPAVTDVAGDQKYTAQYTEAATEYDVDFEVSAYAELGTVTLVYKEESTVQTGTSFKAPYGSKVVFTPSAIPGHTLGFSVVANTVEISDVSGAECSVEITGKTSIIVSTSANTYQLSFDSGISVDVTSNGYGGRSGLLSSPSVIYYGEVLDVKLVGKDGHAGSLFLNEEAISEGSFTVSGAMTFRSVYTPNEYTISWVGFDGKDLGTTKADYGTVPAYSGDTPTRPDDDRYTYSFSGKWSAKADGTSLDPLPEVKGDATYYAVFVGTEKTFTVIWQNYDRTELKTDLGLRYEAIPQYIGDTPAKPQDEQYTYSFSGWSTDGKTVISSLPAVTSDVTYIAVFGGNTRSYTVTWNNYDGTTIKTDVNVLYGTKPVYSGDTPTRDADDQYTYTFKGWDPEITEVHGDQVYTAVYDSSTRSYTVTWKNADGTTLATDTLKYGEMPSYIGDPPTKTGDAQYSYAFSGWDPGIVAVTGDATYTAQFTQSVNEYTVTWKNGETTLETQKVEYGAAPSYSGADPVKDSDVQYSYTFSGSWSLADGGKALESIPSVTGDATYYAHYNSTVRSYLVTIVVGEHTSFSRETEDGTKTFTTDQEFTLKYGQTLEITVYAEEHYRQHLKVDDNEYGNGTTFSHTTEGEHRHEISTSKDVYSIRWFDDDRTTVLDTQKVEYLDLPVYKGTEPSKEGNAQFSYEFTGWNPAIVEAVGDAVYVATYRPVVNEYTVTWKNEDGTVLKTEQARYGVIPSYTGDTPTKGSTAEHTYEFSSWTPTPTSVTGDATYTAQFTEKTRQYTVTWKNEDGAVLKTEQVDYNATPSYTGDPPTKASTAQYSFDSYTWTPAIAPVKADAEYRASFEPTIRSYAVTFSGDHASFGSITGVSGGIADYGTDVTFTVSAVDGYDDDSITVYSNGTPINATGGIYTVRIVGTTSITAVAAADTYPLTIIQPDEDSEAVSVIRDGVRLRSGDPVSHDDELVISIKDPVGYTESLTVNDSPYVSGSSMTVTGSVTVVGTYEINVYTITWYDEDGTTMLDQQQVAYGRTPVYSGETPYKGPDSQNVYVFDGWDPAVAPVSGDADYKAVYRPEQGTYTVVWLDYDGTVLKRETVDFGDTPTNPDTPIRPDDDMRTYRFITWSQDYESSLADAVYVAMYYGSLRYFTIYWEDDDDNVLKTDSVRYGDTPSYGDNPEKASDAGSDYVFSHWTPEIVPATGDAVYTAVFEAVPRTYTVTWVDYNGTVLETDESVAYNTTPEYNGATPTRPDYNGHSFAFSGWSPAVSRVTGDATYTATYASSDLSYTLRFTAGTGTSMTVAIDGIGSLSLGEGEVRSVGGIAYNAAVSVSVTPSTGYGTPSHIRVGTSTVQLTNGSCTFNVTSSGDVVSGAGKLTYNVVLQAVDHTTITLITSPTAQYGDTVRFRVSAEAGYQDNLKAYADGREVGTSGIVSVSMPAKDLVISTATSISTYTVTFNIAEHTYLWYSDTLSLYTSSDSPVTMRFTYGQVMEFNYFVDPGYDQAFSINGVARTTSIMYSQPVVRDMTISSYTEPNKYTVTWKDWDGSVLETDTDVPFGSTPVFNSAAPTRAANAQHAYTFIGWDPAVSTVSGDTVYTAQYRTDTVQYTVTWKNHDGSVLSTVRAGYGSYPVYGGQTPVRASDAEHVYTFSGWSPTVATVTGDAEYTAAFTEADRTYTVTWVNYDGSVLKTDSVAYGDTPSYDGTPARASDEWSDFSFTGWSPAVVPVTTDATYTAAYSRTDRIYTVEFNDPDRADFVCAQGMSFTARYGDEVTFTITMDSPGYTPTVKEGWTGVTSGSETLEPDGSGVYSFTVKGNTVVAATTDPTTYMVHIIGDGVTVMDGSSQVRDGGYVHYNDVLVVTIADRAGHTASVTANHGEIVDGRYTVTSDVTFTGRYDAEQYTITWRNYDGSIIRTDSAAYGTMPSAPAAARADDDAGTYAFAGWTPEVTVVAGDAEYTATYTTTAKTYTVRWVDSDGTLLYSSAVAYGETPSYVGATPHKDQDAQYRYRFSAWTPEIVPVTGDAEYTAVYSTTARTYTVTWQNWDGAVLETDRVAYGDTPTFDHGSDPEREGTSDTRYVFSTWTPSVVAVTGNAAYTAVYTTQYALTLNAGANTAFSEITGSSQQVVGESSAVFWYDASTSARFRATAASGYDAIVIGVDALMGDGLYRVDMTSPKEVTATATAGMYEVTFVPGEHTWFVTEFGMEIHDTGSLFFEYGQTVTYTVHADTGYATYLTLNGSSVQSGSEHSLTVAGDAVVRASTSPDLFSITITGEGVSVFDGTERVNSGDTVHYGQVLSISIADRAGYIGRISCTNGGSADPMENGSITVVGRVVVDGSYEAQQFTVTWRNWDGTVLDTDTVAYGTFPVYGGETPARAGYYFHGWSPAVTTVTGDATYTAVFGTSAAASYTITWLDDDGTVLLQTYVAPGEVPSYAAGTPHKSADAQYRYRWLGWTDAEGGSVIALPAATGDATYYAVYQRTVVQYTVTWKDWNGDDLATARAAYGSETPAYAGPTPVRASDAQYDYAFAGWTPETGTVVSNQTYWAVYTSSVRSYTVTFDPEHITVMNGTVQLSSGDRVPYGTVLTAAADSEPEGVPYIRANGGVEYMFTMSHTVVSDTEFTVSYYSGYYSLTADDGISVYQDGRQLTLPAYVRGGTVLTVSAEGGVAVWNGNVLDGTFTMPSAAAHISYQRSAASFTVTYDPQKVSVTHDGTDVASGSSWPAGTVLEVGALPLDGYSVGLTANGEGISEGEYTLESDVEFERTEDPIFVVTRYTVTFVTENAEVSDVAAGSAAFSTATFEVAAGTSVTFSASPADGYRGVRVAATGSSGTSVIEPENGTYTVVVDSDVTVRVTGTSAESPWVIVWNDWDGELLSVTFADDGQVPVYHGSTPTRDADEHVRYVFAGWTPEVTAAHEHKGYRAVYDEIRDTFTVTWKNWDGTVLETDTVAYGDTPEYSGSVPTRDGYSFSGWSPAVTEVTGDATYTATFSAAVQYFTVTIRGEGVTVMNGSVQVRSGTSVPAGTVLTVTMEQRDGFDAVLTASVGKVADDGSYTVTADVTFTGSYTSSAVVDDDDDKCKFPWWILLLIILLIVLYLVYRHYRNKREEEGSD